MGHPSTPTAAPAPPSGSGRWLVMLSLTMAAGSIYLLPYLRQAYHQPLLAALHVTNTELGILNSAFGVFALVCYLPGGWVADRVAPRLLLSGSLVATGLLGYAFATFPPYPIAFAIHALWGVSTILTFWAALIKATRHWGGEHHQGTAFGLLDGGSGIVSALLGAVALAAFAALGTPIAGLRAVVVAGATATLVAGALVWLFLPADAMTTEGTTEPSRGHVKRALALPAVWLQAVIILAAYAGYWGTFDLAAFAVDGFGTTMVFGASLSTARLWLRPVGALAAGWIADRASASGTVVGCFALLGSTFVVLAATPTAPDLIWLLWVDTIVAATAVFGLRGIYYAVMEENHVPASVTGTAVGIVSIIGYTPDIVMPLVTGWLLDTYPGAAGHQLLYGGLALLAAVGLVAALAMRWTRPARSRGTAPALE